MGDDRQRTPKGGEVLVDDDSDVPVIFGGNRGVDGLLLAAANLMEATTTEGDDERRRAARLEIKTQWQPTGSRRRATSAGTRHKRTGVRGGA